MEVVVLEIKMIEDKELEEDESTDGLGNLELN